MGHKYNVFETNPCPGNLEIIKKLSEYRSNLIDVYTSNQGRAESLMDGANLRLLDAQINSVESLLIDHELDPLAFMDFKIMKRLQEFTTLVKHTQWLVNINISTLESVRHEYGESSLEYKRTLDATNKAIEEATMKYSNFYSWKDSKSSRKTLVPA